MPSPNQTTFIQNNFLIGERRSNESLNNETASSLEELTNYRVLKGGKAKRRPGMKVVSEFPDLDQDIKRFFSLGAGYVILFENNRLVYILGSNRYDLEIRPYHSQRYEIQVGSLAPPESVAYSIGSFALHNVVSSITEEEHSQVRDIFEFGDKIALLPQRGLPFLIYIEDNEVIVEPYFFEVENLDSYESLVRAIPFNNEKHKFKDVLYRNTDIPTGRDDKVRLIIGHDSDLDLGRCKAWLGATKDYETSTEKIDVDKMSLSDLIGVPIIFNVFPDDPVPIPLDFKYTIDETENKIQVVREKNWDEEAAYPEGLLRNLNTETRISTFSFDPTLDSTGAVRGTKATLIREMLYGRRYMIIPFRKNLGSNSSGDLVDYSTTYPTATSTVDAKTSINVEFDIIDDGTEVITDGTISEIEVGNYILSDEEVATDDFDGLFLEAVFDYPFSGGGDSARFDDSRAGVIYYWSREDFNAIGDWEAEESNNGLLPAQDSDHYTLHWGVHDLKQHTDIAYISVRARRGGQNNNVADIRFTLGSNFKVRVDTDQDRVSYSYRINIFGNSDSQPILINSLGTTLNTTRTVFTDTETGAKYIYPFTANITDAVFSSDLNISDSDADDFIRDLLHEADPIKVRIDNISINGAPLTELNILRNALEEPLQIGGKRLETNLGYENPTVSNSIKPIVPEGKFDNVNLNTLSWSSVIEEEEWRDRFIGAYFEVPRNDAGELQNNQAKLVIVSNPVFNELDQIASIELFGESVLSTLTFSDPMNGDTPNGREDLTRVFSLNDPTNPDNLNPFTLFMNSLVSAQEGRGSFKLRFKDSSNNPIQIDIIDYNIGETKAIGYNRDNNVNYLSVNTTADKTKRTLTAGGLIEGSVNVPEVVALGNKKVEVDTGIKYSFFILIKKGSSLASETTLTLGVGTESIVLTKVANSTLSEVEEFMSATPTETEFSRASGVTYPITITKGSDSALFQFVSAQTTVRVSSVFADCMIFELGMTSTVKDGTRRTIGGANFDKKEVEVRQIYTSYPDNYESIVVFKENLALLQDDKVFFLYGNENKANHPIRVLNGTPGEDVKELIIKANYVPGLFSLGYPTVISDYLKSAQSEIKDTIFDAPQTKSLESYLNREGLQSVVDYTKTVVDPKGRIVKLRSGSSVFSGDGIFASSDFGLFSISSEPGRTPSLINAQRFAHELLVFNNKLVFVTPDNLLAIQVQSNERLGLRTLFSGKDQIHLLRDVKDIVFDSVRQLYLMNNEEGDIICATDFDTQVGGFGTWKAEDGKLKVLKLLNTGDTIKAVCRYRRPNESGIDEDVLSIVEFDEDRAYDGTETNSLTYVSKGVSNALINPATNSDNGLFPGHIIMVEMQFVDCDQIKVQFLADNHTPSEREYILKDSQGRVVQDIPSPVQAYSAPKGYNPRIAFIQDGALDNRGFIYGFKMRGSIDGL